MKSTGIIRRLDDLGRIVIPKEIRHRLGVTEGDPMEILVNGNQLILEKYEPGCTFCGGHDGISTFKGKEICEVCRQEVR